MTRHWQPFFIVICLAVIAGSGLVFLGYNKNKTAVFPDALEDGFKRVKDLRLGDEVYVLDNGKLVKDEITQIEKHTGVVQTTYNLFLQKRPKTYFAGDFAVHNGNKPETYRDVGGRIIEERTRLGAPGVVVAISDSSTWFEVITGDDGKFLLPQKVAESQGRRYAVIPKTALDPTSSYTNPKTTNSTHSFWTCVPYYSEIYPTNYGSPSYQCQLPNIGCETNCDFTVTQVPPTCKNGVVCSTDPAYFGTKMCALGSGICQGGLCTCNDSNACTKDTCSATGSCSNRNSYRWFGPNVGACSKTCGVDGTSTLTYTCADDDGNVDPTGLCCLAPKPTLPSAPPAPCTPTPPLCKCDELCSTNADCTDVGSDMSCVIVGAEKGDKRCRPTSCEGESACSCPKAPDCTAEEGTERLLNKDFISDPKDPTNVTWWTRNDANTVESWVDGMLKISSSGSGSGYWNQVISDVKGKNVTIKALVMRDTVLGMGINPYINVAAEINENENWHYNYPNDNTIKSMTSKLRDKYEQISLKIFPVGDDVTRLRVGFNVWNSPVSNSYAEWMSVCVGEPSPVLSGCDGPCTTNADCDNSGITDQNAKFTCHDTGQAVNRFRCRRNGCTGDDHCPSPAGTWGDCTSWGGQCVGVCGGSGTRACTAANCVSTCGGDCTGPIPESPQACTPSCVTPSSCEVTVGFSASAGTSCKSVKINSQGLVYGGAQASCPNAPTP